ncbi:VENN motif pre-toxin domain-containing protein [Snodgrassella communis]|uniref:VENN motif pre-toxin domain-containing protein n=1 Tax=Snodgrassella communis TaxID=2946699 RepID=UPI0027D46C46|nr:VENN motif pre-toxin domain-containing protein [Snodgrassella communis]
MGFVSCGDNPRYKTTHWVVVPILCLQNAIGSGLSAPTNSIDGILAATASPAISYQIGQYFKVLAHKNQITGGKDELTAGQETAHILAHAILGAAVAAAGGNDALAGGLAAAGAEATAPILSQWLYGKNPADLTADEKATISAIAGLTGAATGVTVGGSMADVAQGDQAGHIAVDNNTEFGDKIREYINDTKRYWHTEKEAKDNLDVIRNVAVNLIGDGLDSVVGLADYSIDSLNALVYCTGVTPDLCNQMQATLDPKNKAALDSIKAVFDTRTYIQFYELLDKAAHGDLQAREAAGELLAAVLITKKVNLNVGKVSKAGKSTGKGTSIGKGISNTSTLNPNEIRFSQNTVSYNKVERGTNMKYNYDDLVTNMKTNGWKGDPVDVIKMPDGKFTSMDNTRIAAAREAGIDIKANVRNFDDKLSPAEVSRFSDPRKGFVPTTWGEAITGRINKQSGGFSKNNPYGSNTPPRISGKPKD